jgi:phosphotransferase family enzyme
VITFDHASKQASAEWLTDVLTRNGYLTSGEVTEVAQKPRTFRASTSDFFDLEIKYHSNGAGVAPSRCLLKVSKPGLFQLGRNEAAFYELVRGTQQSKTLLTCFGTSVDNETESAVVLLEDKGDEYYVTEWPLPPQIDVCKQAVRQLAAVHATWWNSPSLQSAGFNRNNDAIVNLSNERSRRFLTLFFDALGDRISEPRRTIIELLHETYPRILKNRIDGTRTQTLVHGDAHFWNVLLPKDASKPPIWIDWQTWGVDFAAFDLAYMIGLHWFPERRSRFEKDLLAVYLAELHQRGVDYRADDLFYDYRLQIPAQIFRPMLQWYMKAPASIWWPHLDRWFSAFDDLDCHELLQA